MRILLLIIEWFGNSVLRIYWYAVYQGYRRRYQINSEFRFNGRGIQMYGDGAIDVGAGSYIGELSTIQAVDRCAVRIGTDCMISHNVRIYTETAIADSDFRIGPGPQKRGDVTIGDGCWIGANVFVGPGVDIGANAVVGANSVVTRSVPGGEIWGGVPARFIRRKQT